jgi:hypothetical protein
MCLFCMYAQGLSIDRLTGIISGYCTKVTFRRNYVVTGNNSGGTINTTIRIAVKDVRPHRCVYVCVHVCGIYI